MGVSLHAAVETSVLAERHKVTMTLTNLGVRIDQLGRCCKLVPFSNIQEIDFYPDER